MSEWWNVNKIVQVWNNHAESQKQGKLHPPAGVNIIEEYKGSGRFEEIRFEGDGFWEKKGEDPNYLEYWVQMEDLSKEPYDPIPDPDPDPSEISDEEAGAALRTIVNFILMLIRGE